MDEFFSTWWDSPDPWRTGMEHMLFLITLIGFIVGSIKGVKVWKKDRAEAIAARIRHEDSIARVLRHLDNGGLTLVTKVDEGNRMLAEHIAEATEWFKANDQAHKEIHSRIDEVLLSERNRRDG